VFSYVVQSLSLNDSYKASQKDPSRRLVLACAERADGGADIQVVFELSAPVVGDHLNENAVREMFFDVPSGARH
jgi:hypothetical protein